MPVTKVGIVYYQDTPDQVFRFVYPTSDDSELDNPQWTTEGCDPARVAVLEQVEPSDPRVAAGFTGVP